MQRTIIIGAGLAGLTAAYYLQKSNQPYLLLEATDRVGGRVKTDEQAGFLMDRGFQVFLTAYPEAKKVLDYSRLDLRAFDPGAMLLRSGGKVDYLGDPLRQPSSLLSTAFTSAATVRDKVNILKTKSAVTDKSIDQIFQEKESTTLELLKQQYGFSNQILEQFLRPFYAGIFLEQNLSTSGRMFEFVFKMFSEGDAAIPASGMEAIPKQILSHLDAKNIRLGQKVKTVQEGAVIMENGEKHRATKVLIATQATGLASKVSKVNRASRSTTNIYFKSAVQPFKRKAIALSTDTSGLVNNMTCMTNVSEKYSDGDHLISVSLKENSAYDANTPKQVLSELSEWYPSAVDWKHLKTYELKYALPLQDHVTNDNIIKVSEHMAIIGDHTMNGSINAAMKSGRLGAEWATKS